MSERRRPARISSPANLLGIARILATPVVIALILIAGPGMGIAAFVLFCLAAFTDFLDGWVARARGEVSPLGVFMDLTADKVLVGGVLIAMVEVDLLPTWIVATILVRELVIAGVRQMAASENVVIPARALGKAKTLTTLVGMAILLLAYDATTGGPLATTGIGLPAQIVGGWVMVFATRAHGRVRVGLPARRAAAAPRRAGVNVSAEVDVVVIGGGATGAGVLRDLAMRGLRALLVERGDFASGTSGRYHGLLHSGARYVESDPISARHCIQENGVLRRIAPATIEPTGGLFVATPDDPDDYVERFPAACAAAGIEAEPVRARPALRRRAAPQPPDPRRVPGARRLARALGARRREPRQRAGARRGGATLPGRHRLRACGRWCSQRGPPARRAQRRGDRDRLPRGRLRRRRVGRQGGRARRRAGSQ